MQTIIPRPIRESIARARGYLGRNEAPRALEALAGALRQSVGLQLARQTRQELERQLTTTLDDLARHSALAPLLDPMGTGTPHPLRYQRDREGVLATVLENFAKMLQEAEARAASNDASARSQRLEELLATGIARIKAGELGSGRAFLQRAAAEFGHDPAVMLRVGQTLLDLGQYVTAAETMEQAMAAAPREPRFYGLAVEAWCAAQEYARAEQAYRAALRHIGGHANTYGKMAQFYLRWQKPEQAAEMATNALQLDPQQPEALAVQRALSASPSGK